MDIEQINTQWGIDSVIDNTNLAVETLRTAALHQKYLALLMRCKQKLIKYDSDLNQMRDLRSRYFQGTLSTDECRSHGWDQYQGLKPLRTDLQVKLDGDSEMITLRVKVQYIEAMHHQLESIMASIKGRDWAIKNWIEYHKFVSGQ